MKIKLLVLLTVALLAGTSFNVHAGKPPKDEAQILISPPMFASEFICSMLNTSQKEISVKLERRAYHGKYSANFSTRATGC